MFQSLYLCLLHNFWGFFSYCLAKANEQTYIFALDRKTELEKELFQTELEVLKVFEGVLQYSFYLIILKALFIMPRLVRFLPQR